jgi:hypothetical protein
MDSNAISKALDRVTLKGMALAKKKYVQWSSTLSLSSLVLLKQPAFNAA